MARVGAATAASAVNALLQFSPDDQTSLLEVIEDYFFPRDDDSDLSDSDDHLKQSSSSLSASL